MNRTVVLVDDHALFRQGVRSIIEDHVTVLGEGATGDDALALVAEHRPDVVLLDVELPGPPAEQTITRIRRLHADTAVVVLTMHSDSVLERQLLRAGASRFLTKTVSGQDLIDSISGARPTRPEGNGQSDDASSCVDLLTARELQVLRMISQAYTNRDIGIELHIAEGTVKRHTTNIYTKLGATSRIDAVRKAFHLGVLKRSTTA